MKKNLKTIGIFCISSLLLVACGNKAKQSDSTKTDTIPVIETVVTTDGEGDYLVYDYVAGEVIVTEHKTLMDEWKGFESLTSDKKKDVITKMKAHNEKLRTEFDAQKLKVSGEWAKFDTLSVEKQKAILEKIDTYSDNVEAKGAKVKADAKEDLSKTHAEILAKWANFENLTVTEKKELIAKRKAFVQKSQADFDTDKSKLDQEWKKFESLTTEKQKALVEKTEKIYHKYFDKK